MNLSVSSPHIDRRFDCSLFSHILAMDCTWHIDILCWLVVINMTFRWRCECIFWGKCVLDIKDKLWYVMTIHVQCVFTSLFYQNQFWTTFTNLLWMKCYSHVLGIICDITQQFEKYVPSRIAPLLNSLQLLDDWLVVCKDLTLSRNPNFNPIHRSQNLTYCIPVCSCWLAINTKKLTLSLFLFCVRFEK